MSKPQTAKGQTSGIVFRCWLVGHVGVVLAAFALIHDIFSHLVGLGPIKPSLVRLGHYGPRGSVVDTSPRVNLIQNQSTLLWGDAALRDSCDTLPVELTLNDGESLGPTDNLARFFFILWEFLPEQIRYVRHSPVGDDHQDLHD